MKKIIYLILVSFLFFYAPFALAGYHFQNGTQISAYVDTSYNYLVRSNSFISGNYNRVYDLQQNGFTMQQFGVVIEKTPPQGMGGFLKFYYWS